MNKTFKRISLICLVVIVTLLTAFGVMGIDTYTTISTPEDFLAINNNLDGKYKLSKDIDFAGVDFSVIGTSETAFTGVLDGNGFTVKNISISVDSLDDVYAAVFAFNKGEITNVKFDNVTVDAKSEASVYAAVVAAANSGDISDVEVTNSSVSADARYNLARAGGVCAYNSKVGNITDCSAYIRANAESEEMYADKDAIVASNLGDVENCTGELQGDILYGDCDGNGVVDLFDLINLAKAIVSSSPTSAEADTNADGVVDLFDLINLAKHIVDSSVVLGPNA